MRFILYDITHQTAYEYLGTVSVSHHLLRLSPRPSGRQHCLEHTLSIEPSPAVISDHIDYFGNKTHFITVDQGHSRLVILSHSRVTVGPAFIPEPAETPGWDTARARCRDDLSRATLEAREFLCGSPLVPLGAEYAEYASPSFPKDRPVLDAVRDLTQRIHDEFTFDATATTVTTPVSEVLEYRRGVCQDFAHLQLACLRSMGLPARYVSGYLETDAPPGLEKLRGADTSHAWISFFCPGLGWIDVDPTNDCFPSLRHITLAWGRDYGDVAPVSGVLMGSEGQSLSVSVDVIAQGATESLHQPGSGSAVAINPFGPTT